MAALRAGLVAAIDAVQPEALDPVTRHEQFGIEVEAVAGERVAAIGAVVDRDANRLIVVYQPHHVLSRVHEYV